MTRRIMPWAIAGTGLAALALTALPRLAPAVADVRPPEMRSSYPAKILLSSGETVAGETIHYPTDGPAQITAEIVTIAPGHKTLLHHHGAPLFAYILDGEVTVDYRGRGQRTFHKGDGFLEAMAVPHLGISTEPVRILAVYMGVKGVKLVVPDTPPAVPETAR